ncbi:MAG: prolipoprotein diacylglyceryl transferase [Candidatus Omnitrophica bacterium]|nr:prolipoprotein diacylglyceryl transferase [Candidatus Omnitrophota bacterium]
MHPILAKLGPITLYTYGAMLVVAFAVATWLASRAAAAWPPSRSPISAEQAVDFSCYALLGGLVGGRLLYVLLEWEWFAQAPLEMFALWHGGLVWYGGFLGGTLAGWLYTRVKRLDFLRVMDHFIPFLALGHAIGRLGCFLNGCCYGKPTQAWCGVLLPGHDGLVLPTQLFEAFGLLVVFLILRPLQRQSVKARPGRVLGGYLILYGGLRFFLESLRGDQTAWRMGLTLQQVVSIGMAAAGITLLVWSNRSTDGQGRPAH